LATAESKFAACSIRPVAVVHSGLAFFFNLAIFGLTIKITDGLV
jgi:uncharacterized membrane protein